MMKIEILLLLVTTSEITCNIKDRRIIERISSPGYSNFRKVLIGRDILIPCKVSSSSSGYALLILLYKGSSKSVIFSIDSRVSQSLMQAKQWSSSAYKGRIKLKLGPEGEEGILLQNVQLDDEGVFTCRTDFLTAPTVRNITELFVINPVKKLDIFLEGKGEKILHQGVIGPFDLGTQLLLTCKAIGGKPYPEVTWWHNNTILDPIMETKGHDIARNTIHLPPLTRQDQYKELTCKAENSEMFPTVSSTVVVKVKGFIKRIKMIANFPIEEPIRGPKIITLSERDRLRLRCETVDENSSMTFIWTKESKSTLKSIDKTMNFTMTVSSSDNEALVTCKGFNSHYSPLKSEEFIDSVQLNVLYKPHAVLSIQNLNINNIEEGDDVYLRCHSDSNPPPSSVEWVMNGSKLPFPSSGRILDPTNASLVLLSVNSTSSKEYFCVVKNAKGISVSNILYLQVKHVPVCVKVKYLIAANLGQTLNITCPIRSYPQANIIRWAYTSSNTSSEFSNYNVLPHVTYLEPLKYTVESPKDFSTLLCWASNPVGQMTEPCSVSIVPTGEPEPVSYCEIFSQEKSTFMKCSEGFDGGHHQSFYLRILRLAENGEHLLINSYNSSLATFNISHLIAGEKYLFNISAWNCEGSSNPVLLTYRKPFSQSGSSLMEDFGDSEGNYRGIVPLVAVISGIILALIACFISAFCCARFRLCRKRIDEEGEESIAEDDLLHERIMTPLFEGKSQSDLRENIYISGGRLVIGVKERKKLCAIHGVKNYVEQENETNIIKSKKEKHKSTKKPEEDPLFRENYEKHFSPSGKSIPSCSSPHLQRSKRKIEEEYEDTSSSEGYEFDSKCSINTVIHNTMIT